MTVNDAQQIVTVVGIGADGWDGLSSRARAALAGAEVIIGGVRQLELITGLVGGECVAWPPAPLLPAVPEVLARYADRGVCVLASGDPMRYGIGSTVVRLLGIDRVQVLPQVSSISLACARLGWAEEDVTVLSAVGRPLHTVHLALHPLRRVLVLTSDPSAASQLAALVRERGFGPSPMALLENLAHPSERIVQGTVQSWDDQPHQRLAIVAIDCRPGPGATLLPLTPGLPDDSYASDGQLTKREVRAVTLSSLGPMPGQRLWDVGGGTGTIGIEWMRAHPSCHAITVEPREDRRLLIAANAAALGVPGLRLVAGEAPAALAGLPRPDAVFVGGGVSVDGVIEACLQALAAGGRLVANAVTLEAESTLAAWHARLGGELLRISVARAAAVGAFTGWRPAMPVTQWIHTLEVTG